MLYIGKIVSTHGIKGELRILSDFQFKEKVFVVGKELIINNNPYKIRTYRKHKNFDMVTLNDYNNINDVLFLLKQKVYFKKEDLVLSDNEILDEDLLNFKVLCNDLEGRVLEIFLASENNKVIRVMLDKEYLIPMNSPLIKRIDKTNKIIEIDLIDGM
ncbi:MAG: 16S rRNA processing protein RimM [Bacilli bacterium]|nr:16S rRNA processing protein RimM [Bacilli bacterium]